MADDGVDQKLKDSDNPSSLYYPAADHSTKPTGMEVDIDPKTMEYLWGRELMELSVDERELNEEHLHGIKSLAVPETQELLNQGLNDMQKVINDLPIQEKRSHLRGLELGSMYIQSLAFRLKFLRCVQFDAKLAAIRYCKCLDLLEEEFGECALMRRLLITDLGKEELSYFQEGQYQVLPSRDCLGRRIACFSFSSPSRTYSTDSVFKVFIYILNAILSEDISTQKHGLVYITLLNQNENYPAVDMHRVHKMYAGTPLFWGAVHLCVPNDDFYRIFTALFLAWLGQRGRKLLRIHRGNRIECNYMLQGFGIPVADIPQMYSGQVKTKNHLRLIKLRTAMDEWQIEKEKRLKSRRRGEKSVRGAIEPFPGIECPEVDFVVLSYSRNGEGALNNHPGNIAFRKIMVNNEGFKRFLKDFDNEEFDVQSKVREIVDDILVDACVDGLQFLSYDREKGYYSEITDKDVLCQSVEMVMRRHRKEFWAHTRARNPGRNNVSSSLLPEPLDLSQKDRMDYCSKCLK